MAILNDYFVNRSRLFSTHICVIVINAVDTISKRKINARILI